MADDLGAAGDNTFREGGALNKISELATKWEARARKAENALLAEERSRRAHRLERAAWAFGGALLALPLERVVRAFFKF